MSDAPIRMRALDPAQSFIVQAPAGSGKTELLTQRILSLLAQAVTEPEEVLAITFTKKAAQEMRERVLSCLVLGQGECPSAAHKQQSWQLAQRVLKRSQDLGWDLLNQPQRLNILTIDALCARLVRMMPILSKIGVMPAIATDPRTLYETAAIKTLDYLLQEKDHNAIALLMHMDNRLDRVTCMIADMLSSREQWLPVMMGHQQHAQMRTVLEHHLQVVVLDKLSHIHTELAFYLRDLTPLIEFACSQGVNMNAEILSKVHAELQPTLDNLAVWQALSTWLLTKEGMLRKSVDKRVGFPAATDGRNKAEKDLYKSQKEAMKGFLDNLAQDEAAVEALQLLSILPAPVYEAEAWDILSALIHILPQAAAMLMVYFDETSQLDFSAIAMASLQALGSEDTPSDLSLKLDMQISHMLVDEFQDTSLIQYELINRLTVGWQSGDGRTLFLVGDPMQSIYRFRQAEVSLFLQAMNQGLGLIALQPLQLTMNFRSQPAVIDWINEAAAQFFPKQADILIGAVPYTPSLAAVTARDTCKPGVYAHIVSDPQHESAQVLDILQEALAAGHQSIAILVRARSHLKEITRLLVRSQLPYQAVELEPLSERPVIQQLLILTRMLVHIGDRSAWLAFLRSALCGLSLADITVIAKRDEPCLIDAMIAALDDRHVSDEGLCVIKRVVPIVTAASESRQQRRLSPSVNGLWLALGGPATCAERSSLDDAQQYFKLLSEEETFGTLLDMSHFVARLDQAYASSSHHDAKIQVMTIHKAKGLEFDVVILPGLSKRPVRGENPVFVWDKMLFAPIHPLFGEPSALYQFILKQRDKKEDVELSRLLYVALTRTRTQCHLLAVMPRDAEGALKPPARGSFAHRLWPVYEAKATVHEPLSALQASDNSVRKPLLRLPPTWMPAGLSQAQRAPSLFQEANRVDTRAFEAACIQDKLFGTYLHQALCDIANAQIFDTAAYEERWHAFGTHYPALLKAINKTLHDPRGRWILSAHTQARSEWSLLCHDRGKPQRYIIDRTFVDEQGRRWIIDYKTSASDEAQAQYAPQLEAYARTIQKIHPGPVYCGLYFPLTSAWIDWEYQLTEEDVVYG